MYIWYSFLDIMVLTICDWRQSFNPMMEPDDDVACQFDASPYLGKNVAANLFPDEVCEMTADGDNGFTFPSGVEEEEEVTETKIIAFINEKVDFVSKFVFFSIFNEHKIPVTHVTQYMT